MDHDPQQQQPHDDPAPALLLELPDRIAFENNGGENDPSDEPRPPKSEWVISIREKLEQARQDNVPCSWAKLSIYRIPRHLIDGDDKAYVPQIVSFGPYHHGKEHLCQMDRHKWRCLHRMLERSNHEIDLYLDSVKKVEKRARACYEGTISMSRDDFVEMMILDGCFMIELFRGVTEGFEEVGYHCDDPFFSNWGLIHMIQWDMIVLENQIPLFILDLLFCLQNGHFNKESLAKQVLRFFDPLKPTDGRLTNLSSNLPESLSSMGEIHCLKLFRQSLLHPGPKHPGTKGSLLKRQQLIHCVTELRKAGIRFSKRNTDSFWDIQFNSGTLEIPRLVIHDMTRSLFFNLIAFEQCHFNCSNEITTYVIFMDQLINSPEDVGHLHNHGIIEHWLGSNAEVADLFNQLCKKVVFDFNDSYLAELSARVNNYSSCRWYRWGFLLKHEYFGNPWSITSFIAALVLLLLTFTQTFYGVYGYYRLGS